MNLVIDIGNTRIKSGWYDADTLSDNLQLDKPSTGIVRDILTRHPVKSILVSSVAGTDLVEEAIRETGLPSPLFLHPGLPLPIKIDYHTPETLGNDRIASAVGAIRMFPLQPLLVMDLGTAITVDFVTADGQFLGGNISPGLSLRFKSLHNFTAKLPLVDKSDLFPDFGKETRSAIIAGVQQGIVHELNGYITAFTSRHDDCRIVVTGGDAAFFAERLKKPIFVYPHLVLDGLNHILNYNKPTGKS